MASETVKFVPAQTGDIEAQSAPVKKERFDYLDLNYKVTSKLFNKEATSEYAVVAAAQKAAYVFAAAFVAILETIQNFIYGTADVGILMANGVRGLLAKKESKPAVVEPESQAQLVNEVQQEKASVSVQQQNPQEPQLARAVVVVINSAESSAPSRAAKVWGYLTTHKKELALGTLGLAAVGAAGYAGYVYGLPSYIQGLLNSALGGSGYGYSYGYGA